MWYYNDVKLAVGEKYVSGYEDGTFKPNNSITRAEACSMLARIIGGSPSIKQNFSDEIPNWAKDAVSLVVEKGYITGYPDNTFGALKNITRGEAASVLYRVQSSTKHSETKQVEKPKKEEMKKEEPKKEDKKTTETKKNNSKRRSGSGGGSSSKPSKPSKPNKPTPPSKPSLEKEAEKAIKEIPAISSTTDATKNKDKIKEASQKYNKLSQLERNNIGSTEKEKLDKAIIELSKVTPTNSNIKIKDDETDKKVEKNATSAKVTSTANFSDFVGVTVGENGAKKVLEDGRDYNATSGSTKITLTSDFIASHSNDSTITITIVSTSGSVKTNITIEKNSTPSLNKTALTNAINNAKAKVKDVQKSTDGKDVEQTKKWATESEINTFNQAITKAESVLNTAQEQAKLEQATTEINIAINNFNPKSGTKGILSPEEELRKAKEKLRLSINEANNLLRDTEVSDNANKVPKGLNYVSQNDHDIFIQAIGEANKVLSNQTSTETNLENARTTLNTAIDSFKKAMKQGTKVESQDEKDFRLAKEALRKLINEIDSKLTNNSIAFPSTSGDGSDVERGKNYCTQAQIEQLTLVINEASSEVMKDSNQTSKQKLIDTKTKLENAIETFENSVKNQIGSKLPKDEQELKETIQANLDNLKNLVNNATVSVDGSEIEIGKYWMTEQNKQDLLNAIQELETEINKKNVTKDQLENTNKKQEELFQKYRNSLVEGKKVTP